MKRLTFARQIYLLQVVVVLVAVGIATVVYGALATLDNRADAESTALAIARTVAQTPDVRVEVERLSALDELGTPGELAAGAVQAAAVGIGERTGALFVVVTDDRGLRVAHPTASMLGERVSTDPGEALAGREETRWEAGTLGDSARAKVPVFAPGSESRVVGEVSVGFGAASVLDRLGDDLLAVALTAALALAVGVGASALLSRRLRRQTLGLQPSELAGLVHDQTAVIGGIAEGVLGVSVDGRVTVCNDRAEHLLGLSSPVGRDIRSLRVSGEPGPSGDPGLPEELLSALAEVSAHSPRSLRLVTGGRILYADVVRVARDGVDLGAVVSLRDETDVESLSRRLTAVSALSTALRVQRHEFANQLHLVSGLLATGQVAAAGEYLGGVLATGPVAYPLAESALVTEPYLQAFLGAKSIEAHERGVALRIGEGTMVRGTLVRPDEVTTVLGNLIDNAVAAAVAGGRLPREVEVEVLDDGADLHLAVSDSGDGVAGDPWAPRTSPIATPRATADPVDPSQVRGLGFGLPLARDIARRGGGDVWVADPGGAASGALFCARLTNVVGPTKGD
jgi:two-component system CitB family sensor kinase